METQVINATEYRNVPLSLLNPSRTNPRRTFEDAALKELAESIRAQGVPSPLLVRPLTENGFDIVFGERRYRAAQLAGQDTVPVRRGRRQRRGCSSDLAPSVSARARKRCCRY